MEGARQMNKYTDENNKKKNTKRKKKRTPKEKKKNQNRRFHALRPFVTQDQTIDCDKGKHSNHLRLEYEGDKNEIITIFYTAANC